MKFLRATRHQRRLTDAHLLVRCTFEIYRRYGSTGIPARVESRCGAVAEGRSYLLPPLALAVPHWFGRGSVSTPTEGPARSNVLTIPSSPIDGTTGIGPFSTLRPQAACTLEQGCHRPHSLRLTCRVKLLPFRDRLPGHLTRHAAPHPQCVPHELRRGCPLIRSGPLPAPQRGGLGSILSSRSRHQDLGGRVPLVAGGLGECRADRGFRSPSMRRYPHPTL